MDGSNDRDHRPGLVRNGDRAVSPSQQLSADGQSGCPVESLSGGFLLVSILGPMILAGAGSLTTFHGRSSQKAENAAPSLDNSAKKSSSEEIR